MVSLQNIPTISEEKRKKRKAPSKRKTSVLKEKKSQWMSGVNYIKLLQTYQLEKHYYMLFLELQIHLLYNLIY